MLRHACSDALGHRSIHSTAVYTALAPNRFKDFWRQGKRGPWRRAIIASSPQLTALPSKPAKHAPNVAPTSSRRASCAGGSWHPGIGLTQVTVAFYHSRNGNKVALWTMAEIIEYRGYRLSVEPHAPGSKILIFPPGSSLPLPTILFQRNRTRLDGLIKDAKDIVDDHLAMSAKNDAPKGAPSWWRHYRSQ